MRDTPGELPPPALARRMRAALDSYRAAAGAGRDAGADAGTHVLTPEGHLGAAEALLTQLLCADPTSRDCALDLLAADALVTLAFELAGDDPARIEARAELATARLAALASAPSSDR